VNNQVESNFKLAAIFMESRFFVNFKFFVKNDFGKKIYKTKVKSKMSTRLLTHLKMTQNVKNLHRMKCERKASE